MLCSNDDKIAIFVYPNHHLEKISATLELMKYRSAQLR